MRQMENGTKDGPHTMLCCGDVFVLHNDRRKTITMAWEIDEYDVTLTLTQPMLATKPNKQVYMKWLIEKQTKEMKKEERSEDDIAAEVERIKKDLDHTVDDESGESAKFTTFSKDETGVYIESYMIRGYLKNAGQTLKQYGAQKQLKSLLNKYCFVGPDKIYVAPPDTKHEKVERPLRAQTPMGERVSIAVSDQLPAGTEIKFRVKCLQGYVKRGLLETLFDYGEFQGLGQWRNSGIYGTFTYTLTEAGETKLEKAQKRVATIHDEVDCEPPAPVSDYKLGS